MSILTPFFLILLITPLIVLATYRSGKVEWKYLLIFVIYFVVEFLLSYWGNSIDLKQYGLTWNWAGKAFTLLLAIGFLFFHSQSERKEMGFHTKFSSSTLKGVLIFLAFLAFDFVFKFILFPKGQDSTIETITFQATMPGLTEEILYRGIYLWLLEKAIPSKFSIGKISLTWGLLIATVLFGVAHGAVLTETLQVKFDFVTILYLTLISSLSLGILRKLSGNLVLPILGHNVINLMNLFIRSL